MKINWSKDPHQESNQRPLAWLVCLKGILWIDELEDSEVSEDYLDNLVLYFITQRCQEAPVHETCATATHPRDEIYQILLI